MDQDLKRRLKNLRESPRCGARTRSGTACRCPALRHRRRCKLHGGLSPGAPVNEANGNYRNGDWTKQASAERQWIKSLVDGIKRDGK